MCLMGIMVSEVYEALIDAGASEAKAKAAAEAIPVSEQLATKQDIAELKSDMDLLKAEVKSDMDLLKAELKADIGKLEVSTKAEIAGLKADFKIVKYVFAPAVILLLLKIAFFS